MINVKNAKIVEVKVQANYSGEYGWSTSVYGYLHGNIFNLPELDNQHSLGKHTPMKKAYLIVIDEEDNQEEDKNT